MRGKVSRSLRNETRTEPQLTYKVMEVFVWVGKRVLIRDDFHSSSPPASVSLGLREVLQLRKLSRATNRFYSYVMHELCYICSLSQRPEDVGLLGIESRLRSRVENIRGGPPIWGSGEGLTTSYPNKPAMLQNVTQGLGLARTARMHT
jgi:hypothetical protein